MHFQQDKLLETFHLDTVFLDSYSLDNYLAEDKGQPVLSENSLLEAVAEASAAAEEQVQAPVQV